MPRDYEYFDDPVYRPKLSAILIAIAFWSVLGFVGAILFAVLT